MRLFLFSFWAFVIHAMVLVTALPAPSGENPNIVHMKHHLSHDAQQTRFTRPQVAPLAHMRCEEQRDEKVRATCEVYSCMMVWWILISVLGAGAFQGN